MSRSPGSRVYVGGLLDSVRKEDLEREFSKYGKLSHVWVAWNPPGFAFIEFDDQRDAEEAVRAMNGQDVCGSRIRVELSRGRGRGGGGMRGARGGRGGRGGRGSDRGGRGGFRGSGGGRGMGRGRGMRDRGGRSFGGGGGYSRGGRSGRDRYGDDMMGSSSYKDMSSRGGDRGDRFEQYDSGDYYSRSSMSSSYRSRSPIGGRSLTDSNAEDYSSSAASYGYNAGDYSSTDYSSQREYGEEGMASQDGYEF